MTFTAHFNDNGDLLITVDDIYTVGVQKEWMDSPNEETYDPNWRDTAKGKIERGTNPRADLPFGSMNAVEIEAFNGAIDAA